MLLQYDNDEQIINDCQHGHSQVFPGLIELPQHHYLIATTPIDCHDAVLYCQQLLHYIYIRKNLYSGNQEVSYFGDITLELV